jgi:hypothetical protein
MVVYCKLRKKEKLWTSIQDTEIPNGEYNIVCVSVCVCVCTVTVSCVCEMRRHTASVRLAVSTVLIRNCCIHQVEESS